MAMQSTPENISQRLQRRLSKKTCGTGQIELLMEFDAPTLPLTLESQEKVQTGEPANFLVGSIVVAEYNL